MRGVLKTGSSKIERLGWFARFAVRKTQRSVSSTNNVPRLNWNQRRFCFGLPEVPMSTSSVTSAGGLDLATIAETIHQNGTRFEPISAY